MERNAEEITAEDVSRLGRLIKDLMQAARYNQDFAKHERDVRAAASREVKEIGRQNGISDELLAIIDERLMGAAPG